jgi:hypothetical protein
VGYSGGLRYALDIVAGMIQSQFLFCCRTRRYVDKPSRKLRILEHAVDSLKTLGAFGMILAGDMIQIALILDHDGFMHRELLLAGCSFFSAHEQGAARWFTGK